MNNYSLRLSRRRLFRRLLLYEEDRFLGRSRTAKDYVVFLSHASDIVPYVEQITYCCPAWNAQDAKHLKTLLRLPNVYRLNFHYCDLRSFFSLGNSALQRISEICLLNCRLNWLALHSVLEPCEVLQTLHLRGHIGTFGGPCVVHKDIRNKLISIKRLHLDLTIFSRILPITVWWGYFSGSSLYSFRTYICSGVFGALNAILCSSSTLNSFECIILGADIGCRHASYQILNIFHRPTN